MSIPSFEKEHQAVNHNRVSFVLVVLLFQTARVWPRKWQILAG